jgi:hypothetical protein
MGPSMVSHDVVRLFVAGLLLCGVWSEAQAWGAKGHGSSGIWPAASSPVWSKYSNSPSHEKLRFYHRRCFGLSSAPL